MVYTQLHSFVRLCIMHYKCNITFLDTGPEILMQYMTMEPSDDITDNVSDPTPNASASTTSINQRQKKWKNYYSVDAIINRNKNH